MINSVFGWGERSDWEDEEKKVLLLFVSDKKVWQEKGHSSDRTNPEEKAFLRKLDLWEECEAMFSPNPDNPRSKEELHQLLLEAGFEYDEKFEECMSQWCE